MRPDHPYGPDWCEALYQQKASELLLYGRALGLSHSEVEDVLQETFVALIQRASPPANPLHYALRAYRNRCLNYRRSLWRRLTRELESKRWFEPGAGQDPAENRAMTALVRLPPEQREVIVLKIWHGLTFEEIAELSRTSANTVAGRYRYGLEKLRKTLKDRNYEDADDRLGDAFALLGASAPLPKP